MANDNALENRAPELVIPSPEVTAATAEIQSRCKTAGFAFEEVQGPGSEKAMRVGMKCGRDTRWLHLPLGSRAIGFLSIPFERWIFLSGYEAICSYEDGLIEAAFRPSTAGFMPSAFVYRRLFGLDSGPDVPDLKSVKLVLEQPQKGFPRIEISMASEIFGILVRFPPRPRLTLKLNSCDVTRHDEALSLLKKVAGSLFFQIDLLADVPLVLERERRPLLGARRPRKHIELSADLQYPKTEFDDAPLSLYCRGTILCLTCPVWEVASFSRRGATASPYGSNRQSPGAASPCIRRLK